MDILEIFLESLTTLTVNKMRTGLAILGIVIGIGSVIALISLGQGSQKAIENQIQSLGSNLITVSPGGQNTGGVRGAAGGSTTLTLDDAKAIELAKLPSVKSVSPEFSRRTQVVAGRNNTNTQIIGVLPQYATIRKINMALGNFIGEADKTAVLGSKAATDLFGEDVNPIGLSIRINGQILKVIGVTESKGGSGFNNADDAIYAPLSTVQKQLFGASHLTSIAIEAKDSNLMTSAQDAVGYLLLARHKFNNPSQADFSILSQNDILSTASSITGTLTTLLGGIAAISLLVGGIGIMNIMLVTVTERTREIGLRKALGAKRKIIITQFLIEAILLTLVGGSLGTLLGIGISLTLSKIMNIPFAISISSIFLAIGVSGGIGIIFGWYPAQRAASLQPIEALRYE